MEKKSFLQKLKSKKAKILAVVGATTLASTSAFADVTFDKTSGFGGSIDLTHFYGAAAIVITAYAGMWVIKRCIGMFRG